MVNIQGVIRGVNSGGGYMGQDKEKSSYKFICLLDTPFFLLDNLYHWKSLINI